jgi:hypothetical protein
MDRVGFEPTTSAMPTKKLRLDFIVDRRSVVASNLTFALLSHTGTDQTKELP